MLGYNIWHDDPQNKRIKNSMEQRMFIKYHANIGTTATKTYEVLRQVCGGDCLSRTRVFQWHKQFREGRESVEDEDHARRPRTARTPEMIQKVRDFIALDHKATTRMIAESLGISKETVRIILNEDLYNNENVQTSSNELPTFPSAESYTPQDTTTHENLQDESIYEDVPADEDPLIQIMKEDTSIEENILEPELVHIKQEPEDEEEESQPRRKRRRSIERSKEDEEQKNDTTITSPASSEKLQLRKEYYDKKLKLLARQTISLEIISEKLCHLVDKLARNN